MNSILSLAMELTSSNRIYLVRLTILSLALAALRNSLCHKFAHIAGKELSCPISLALTVSTGSTAIGV